jgi:hypothetical protein
MNVKRMRFGAGAALVGGVIPVAVAATLALASIPDADGVIHGCYKNKTGSLRVIDPPAACGSGETALDWNQAGQPGGVSGYQIISGDPVTVDPGVSQEAQVSCPAGKLAVGGGYIAGGSVRVISSAPAGAGTVWFAVGINTSDASSDFIRARVVCADVTT